jgi:rubrerythrin
MKPIPKVNPRQVDKETLLAILREEAVKKLEREHRRRKGRVDTNPIEPGRRFAGTRDITDLSQDKPWQLEAYEKLGVVIPYGTYYTCPKCGQRYLKAHPPKVCKCGFVTALGRLMKEKGMKR